MSDKREVGNGKLPSGSSTGRKKFQRQNETDAMSHGRKKMGEIQGVHHLDT